MRQIAPFQQLAGVRLKLVTKENVPICRQATKYWLWLSGSRSFSSALAKL
jgi:hypothetical protein